MADFVEEIERFLASFSPEEEAVLRHAFRALLDGQPVIIMGLPVALGLPPAVVEAAVENLTKRGTMVVEPDTGRIVGTRGLSTVEASHHLTLDGRQLYAWCAVDAVGIPAALGVEATIESRCYHCQAPLRLTVKDGAVTGIPPGIVIWAVERDLSRSLRAYT